MTERRQRRPLKRDHHNGRKGSEQRPELEAPEQDQLVSGRNPAIEVLNSDRDINKLFLQEGISGEKIAQILSLAKEKRIPFTFVPKTKLDQLTDGGVHQGVVVAASPVSYASLDDLFKRAEEQKEAPFFLLLDGIEDPHNLGSILRTADASGVHGIIIPKRRATGLTAVVAKASAGAIENVPVVRVTNLVQTIQELKERGLWLFGTDMDGDNYQSFESDMPVGIVIGNEGKGMSRLVKEQMDGMLTIPMKGTIQSLNAGVAAGLLMYEVFRKREHR